MRIFCAAFLFGLSASPVAALDVEFTGVVVSSCALTLSTPGALAMSADGTVMGSEVGVGVPAVVLVLSIGNNTIDMAAPTRITADPAGYDAGDETIEASYWGADGLALISQGYTAAPTSFITNSIPLSVLTVNNRITNSAGFSPGTYTTQTVVTCN